MTPPPRRFTAAEFRETPQRVNLAACSGHVPSNLTEKCEYAAATLEGLATFRQHMTAELARLKIEVETSGPLDEPRLSQARALVWIVEAQTLDGLRATLDRLVPLADPLPETPDAQA